MRFRASMRLQKVRARRLQRRDAFFLLINAVKCDGHANVFALQPIYTGLALLGADWLSVGLIVVRLNVLDLSSWTGWGNN